MLQQIFKISMEQLRYTIIILSFEDGCCFIDGGKEYRYCSSIAYINFQLYLILCFNLASFARNCWAAKRAKGTNNNMKILLTEIVCIVQRWYKKCLLVFFFHIAIYHRLPVLVNFSRRMLMLSSKNPPLCIRAPWIIYRQVPNLEQLKQTIY